MEISEHQILHIKKAFNKMKSKEDFLVLLNYAKRIIYGQGTIPFELKNLNYYINPKSNLNRYYQFTVKKKAGGERIIHAPSDGLKAIQKCLNLVLQNIYNPHSSATGFVKAKSIVDNASLHASSLYVYNIDLKDFFPSIDQARVWGRLKHPPFNLNEKTKRLHLTNMIASLSCHEMSVERMDENDQWQLVRRNVLPQGAPTSPTITNIICQQLDFYLSAVAKRFGLRYTRYADDITFSSMHNVYQSDSPFLAELHRIIRQQKFYIKESKTRLQKDKYRQEVTGLVINEKTNVQKKYLKRLRMWLYYWETYGFQYANKVFLSHYTSDKGHVKNTDTNIAKVLEGKLNYLRMVKGSDNKIYSKLKERFEILVQHHRKFKPKTIDLTPHTQVNSKPKETVKFLKYFKYDNEFSFKKLVHIPLEDENFDYLALLKSANNEFIELTTAPDKKINLPKNLVGGVQGLFDVLGTVGLNYFRDTGKHPLLNKEVGATLQKFKSNYRFGNETTESSILSNLILNIANKRVYRDNMKDIVYSFGANDTSGIFKISQLVFNPDLIKFQSKANFFTWVPNIKIAFSALFDCILKHSNVLGARDFQAPEKKFLIELNRSLEDDDLKVELSILDVNSVFLGHFGSIMDDMRSVFFPVLVGICDFKIQFKGSDHKNYECKVLPYSEAVREIFETVEGFKYIFTFYD